MKKVCSTVLILFLISVPCVSAYETLNTIFVNGAASMVMDGNLDDWGPYNLPEIPVTHPIDKTRDTAEVILTRGDADCAFSFKCFADQKFVYFALIVKDDEVIVGQNGFGYGWLEDSNTLYFDGDCIDIEKPYFDANDGQLKVIGDPPNGVKYIEGDTPYFLKVIPYFWEARGILSGFQMTEDGYITEIAIPADVLGWGAVSIGKQMGANLRVVDMDSDMNPDESDKGYIWAPDPDHTAHVCTKSYNRIAFSTTVPPISSSSQATSIIQTDGGISVTLGMPDITKGRALLNDVLVDLAIPDFEAAADKLLAVQNELWAKPLLGYIQLKKGDIEIGTNQLIAFGEQCPDVWGEEYIQVFLKECVQDMLQSYKGERGPVTHEVIDSIVLIIGTFLDKYPNESIVTRRNLQCLHNVSNFDNNEFISLHKEIIGRCKNDSETLLVFSSLMQRYYSMQDVNSLKLTCIELKSTGIEYENNEIIKLLMSIITPLGLSE